MTAGHLHRPQVEIREIAGITGQKFSGRGA